MTSQSFSGEYKLILEKANGTIVDTGWFNNIVLDQGLNYLGTVPSYNNYTQLSSTAARIYNGPTAYIRVGSGSSAAVATQTALDAQTGYASSYINITTGQPVVATSPTQQFVILLNIGTPPGIPGSGWATPGVIQEVGAGWSSTGNTLFSRAVLPTPLITSSGDKLTVYYKLTRTTESFPVTGSVTINGVVYNYSATYGTPPLPTSNYVTPAKVTCAYQAGALPGNGYVTLNGVSQPTVATFPIGYTVSPYVQSSNYIDCTSAFALPQNWAGTGVKAIWVQYSNMAVQMHFSTVIPATPGNTLSLTLRAPWGR
jgi:hypothetical protein